MKEGKQKSSRKLLMLAVCVAFALEFVGCKEGTGAASTTEPAGAAGATNSAATNASMSTDTNTTTAATTSQ